MTARTVLAMGLALAAALLGSAFGNAVPARLDTAVRLPTSGLRGSLQNPCWSPSGDRLVLTHWTRRYNEGRAIVVVVSAARAGRATTLSPTDAESVNLPGACWSRITDEVVYTSDVEDGDQVYVVRASGGTPRRITSPPQIAFEPTFSPDGSWIVFESHRAGPAGAIWKVRADGSELQQLTTGYDDRQPSWAPRGNLILFQRHVSGRIDLWTMNVNGGRQRNITRTPGLEETDASWSPSGRYIVFSSDGEDIELASLFTMTAEGRARRQLTRTRGFYDGAPSWSPSGRRIAFESAPRDPEGSSGTHIWTIAAPPGRG